MNKSNKQQTTHKQEKVERLYELLNRAIRLAETAQQQGWHPDWHSELKDVKAARDKEAQS